MMLILVYIGLLMAIQNKVSHSCSRRRSPPSPSPSPRNCVPSQWSEWSNCSYDCGNAGFQTRTRSKSVTECCGGKCPYHFQEKKACNRNACRNGGSPSYGRCSCNRGWTGTCCQTDLDECKSNPCQHNCTNVPGSYTCSCNLCYTKNGTSCDLRQCKIGGICYPYGRINLSNQCQDCQETRKTAWTNNNALSCSDGQLCTRNDRCMNGECIGTSFSCRSCERCDGNGCQIKPGFCLINGNCYSNGNIRPGKPCQQCTSNSPRRWTANNNLRCSDSNVRTRNDRCINGECQGDPFTCLSCQEHINDTCRLKTGYCLIKYNNVDTCYSTNTRKAGNPCQWCQPGTSKIAWTNRNGISCDDGQECTKSDACHNGQCGGISFICNSLCQYCDGSACSLKTGFGYVAGNCTCKIAGKDYNHKQLNPSNECQWCDLHDKYSKLSSIWSNKPAVSCNDGDACTKQDLCQNGRCLGKAYSCRSSYELSSCIQSSQCVGNGTCRDIMRSKGTLCRAAEDRCDQPERCNGVLGTCPPRNINVIKLKSGQTVLTFPNFRTFTSFQSTTDKLYLKLTGFSVTCGNLTIKWSLLTAKDSCFPGQNTSNLLNTNLHVLTGLTLENGKTYKVVVQASDVRGQTGLPVCSNPVTIDTSKPTVGWIRDGLGSKDVQFQSSKSVSAIWGGFTTTHGIAKYEIAVYSESTAGDVLLQPFSSVNLKASFSKTFSAIADGSKVTTKVRAYTKAGLFSEISSDGVTVDTSEPKPGTVSDGLTVSSDLKYASWTTTFEASWTQFMDLHTPIAEYTLRVKQKNGGLVSSGLTVIGSKRAAQISGLSLASGVEYCAIIIGINAAGLSSQATSNCVLIDHAAPQAGTVNDGNSHDIDYQSGDRVYHANWKGFDDGQKGSGLLEYRNKLTDKNNNNITSWASSGLQTNVTLTGLNLVNGNTYYLTVRAIDNVGHYKDVKSDGVFIDTTHPVYTGNISVKGEIAQKNGETVVYIQNNDSITASWGQVLDEHSGIKKYQWAISQKSVQPTLWKDTPGVKLATTAVFGSLSLTNNKEYQMTIRAINNAGLYTDIKSPVIIPLSAAPGVGTVSDGGIISTDIDYQTNTSEVLATWKGFETSNVKVRAYFFAVGSCIKGNYHVTNNQFIPVTPRTATWFKIRGLSLVNGQRYCVKIKAENLAGVQSDPVSSDGFIVDVTPPAIKRAMVLDGSGDDDIDYQSSRKELFATWTGIQDYDSGIKNFDVAVSRNRIGQPDVTSFIDVGHNTSANITGLNLYNDVYYVILCAVNNAGLKSCLASDGVLIDPTVSTSGVVHDGLLEPDIRYQSSTTKMSANWKGIWDLESRVQRFEWGIREEHSEIVFDFHDVGLQTHVSTDKVLNLSHGHNYTVYLRVYNRAGGLQELKSDGVTVDTTPPVPSEISIEPSSSQWQFFRETGTHYSSTASALHVNWKDFEEPESEIWYYKWAIGTSKCGTQLQPLINIGLLTHANTSGTEVHIRPGVQYYVTVVARNRANLASRACSSPFLFDYTPPLAGIIQVTSKARTEKFYFRSEEDLRISWSDFEDFESRIAKYEIFVVESNTTMLNYTLPYNQSQHEIPLVNLSPGTKVTIILNAVNYASLETKVFSKPFVIDNTPPFYTGVKDGSIKSLFQSNSNSLKVAWERFDDDKSPVEFYEIGIGTQPSRDDIHEFKKTGLRTYFHFNGLDLAVNQMHYVTVRATNGAGLVTSLVLEGVIVDQTPPTIVNGSVTDGISAGDVDFISINDSVSATWRNIKDLESGIDRFEYCVGSTPLNCLIKPFTLMHQNKSFVCQDCIIHTGMKVFSKIRATNGAGLSTIFSSNGMVVDSSPPEIGRVLDGEKSERPDVEKVGLSWLPLVTWYGAQDIQSGLKQCQWIIVEHDGISKVTIYKKALDQTKLTYDVRHTERPASSVKLKLNKSYSNAIICWNNAGINTYKYSNGWTVVEEWPLTSYVLDGLGVIDMDYDVTGEILGASWGAFYSDLQDPVIKYEWAVGPLGAPEGIKEFTDKGLDTRASKSLSDSEIELEPGVRYYVTVRATSLSGRTSNKSSNGFILDRTAPSTGVVKVSHKISKPNTHEVDYTLTWHGFSDLETGIRNYDFCLGYIENVCATVVRSAGLELQGIVPHFIPADTDTPFYGIVIVTNYASLKTIVSSNAIKLDFTPPLPGRVIDGIEKDFDYINDSIPLATTWSAFTDPETGIEKCTLTVREENLVDHVSMTTILKMTVNASGSLTHNLILIPTLQYISTIECQNPDGFKTLASSNGVVVDVTPPFASSVFHGTEKSAESRFQSDTNSLEASWNPGSDPESGIMEYLVAVGSGPNDDDVRGFFSAGKANDVKIENITLNSGKTYYATLEVVNNAGLTSRISSSGIRIDKTPPIITKVQLQSSISSKSFIGPWEYLTGNWDAYDAESSIGFTEYCIGTTVGGCQTQDMQRVPDNQTTVTCLECKLRHGYTYFLTIRVWNKAGLFSLATTKGIFVDSTPPRTGKVSLNKLFIPCLRNCSMSATISGFIDEESGIKECEFSVKTTSGSIVTPPQATTSENHILVENLTLKHGDSYKISVACTNTLDERSLEVDSSQVMIDNTPPEQGMVIISPDANHDRRLEHAGCQFLNKTLRIYWTHFHDKESQISAFRAAIGRSPLGYDIVPFQNFHINSEANFELPESYGLSRGEIIYATVEAINRAGLVTKVSSQPTRLLSDKDSNLLNERNFKCLNV